MATMNDFLSTYLNLDQLEMAKRQQRVAEVTQRAQQLGAAQQILSQTSDPAQQEQLIKFFGPLLGEGGEGMLRQVAGGTSPTVATTQARIVAENAPNLPAGAGQDVALATLGGTNRAGVAQSGVVEQLLAQNIPENIQQAWLAKTFAGMGPGELAVSERVAGSPTAQQMATGEMLTAPQAASNATQNRQIGVQEQLGWANNRLGWGQLAAQTALGEAQLTARLQQAQQQALAAGDDNAIELLQEIGNIEKLIQQGNMNRDAIARNLTVMKDYYRRLVAAGYEQFRPMAEMDVNEATENTFVPGAGYKWLGSRGPGNW